MTTLPLPGLAETPVRQSFHGLANDLLGPNGPSISTMRNYRFAILQYRPADELEVRGEAQRLTQQLIAHGWSVITIDLGRLLLDRIRARGPDFARKVIEGERMTSRYDPGRGLEHLKSKLDPVIEGPSAPNRSQPMGGLAKDCADLIQAQLARHPDRRDTTLALIGRAGAVYPFFRSSALLRQLDGKTGNVPVVLLYPGTREGQTGLRFMGVLPADHDYRPRIY